VWCFFISYSLMFLSFCSARPLSILKNFFMI
jgi:hypothetical protein